MEGASYVESVPQDTRTRPSVDTVKPRTAPWCPGYRHTVLLFIHLKK